ncbi:ATP-binding protein [Caulobacter sp. Root1455]|uniref:ATP-binding protein n=1 Tax=Caulobacter sp. Root1455 TaxID=1736465 RepID=UPI0012E3DF29|nr:ATP-binding protein [Caulobacter sp. Root1455]
MAKFKIVSPTLAQAIGFVLTVTILVTLVILGAQQYLAGSQSETEALADGLNAQRILADSLKVQQGLMDLEQWQRALLLTGSSAPPLGTRPVEEARTRIATSLKVVRAASRHDPQATPHIDRLEALARERLKLIDTASRAREAGRRARAIEILTSAENRDLLRRTRLETSSIINAARDAQTRSYALQISQGRKLGAYGVGIALVAIVALLVTALSVALERLATYRSTVIQRLMNEELAVARSAAESAAQGKSRFLAAASHDMRQPLHALALYLAALERRVETTEAKEILTNMDSAVRVMTRLFSALLDLARLEAGVLRPEVSAFEIGGLLQDVAAVSSELNTSYESRITVVPTNLKVLSDADLLEIVVRNLASNAIKYSNGGRVLIGCRRAGDWVRVEVHDDGPGIPSERLKDMFTEFVRGEGVGATEGVGLGLSIVQRLTDMLGHELTVRSREGSGSIFAITLPMATSSPKPAFTPKGHLPGVRILLGDDEPLALSAMRMSLEDAGAIVQTAGSRARLIELSRQPFDLLVLDLRFGEADGLTLLEDLEILLARPLPCLIVTGSTSSDVLDRLRRSNRRWVIKPVSAEQLASAAATELQRRPLRTGKPVSR